MNRNKFWEKGFALGPGFSRSLSIMVEVFASACSILLDLEVENSGWTQPWILPSKVTPATHLSW